MSLQLTSGRPGGTRPFEFGGFFPLLAGIAGFVAKAVPVVTSIISGVQQVRAAVQPAPVAPPPMMEAPPGEEQDIFALLDSLSDDELIQLAVEEGLIEAPMPGPSLLGRAAELSPLFVSRRVEIPPRVLSAAAGQLSAPAIRTSAEFTTAVAGGGRFFGRELM